MKNMVIAAAVAAACTPATAAAQDGRSVRVAHADLRLERDGDVARLDRRIWRAARDACGPVSDWDLGGANDARRCRSETRASVAAERDRLVERARRVAAR